MKSPEEQIDKALRNALKRKFDDFESSPAPSLSKKIFKGITEDPGVIQKALILSLLLLIIVTGALMFTSVPGENREARLGRKLRANGLRAQENVAQSTQKRVINNFRKPASDDVIATNKISITKVNAPEAAIQIKESSQIAHLEPRYSAKEKTLTTGKKIKEDFTPAGPIEPSVNVAKDFNVETVTATSVAATNVMADQKEVFQTVNPLENKPVHPYQLHFVQDSITPVAHFESRDDTYQKYRWGFIFGVAPLRTFQMLTVGPTNNVIYQNFSFPTKISAQTLGFKFTAGVEKSGFQFLFNYGRFRQSFKYEIATDEFVLNPDYSGEHKVVRKGTPVEENSLSNLVGISVKKHYVRRNFFLKNYFGDVGVELNRDLTSKKNLIWMNAGFGKELVVDANTRIVVGPYIEYSFMKLRNDQNQFTVQPYQIGLSVGLKFLKK